MGASINVTLPENIAQYLHMKAKEEYLPISAVARQYIAKCVVEEIVIDRYRQGFSIHRLAEMTESPISRVMEILRTLNEELDGLDEDLEEISSF